MVTRFRNANLSLMELEIAGNALLGYGMIFMIFLLWKRVFLKSCMKYFSIIEKDILEEEHGSSIAESYKEISRS